MKHFFILSFFIISYLAPAQTNLLLENKKLLLEISNYDHIYQIDDSLIKFQLDSIYKINFGFGIAHRNSGQLIYPAHINNAHRINRYGKTISFAKGNHLRQLKYGLINFKGDTLLDFIYDKIGGVFVPLPDSIVTVQQSYQFGIFNLNTLQLSDIKYDSSGNWLNDGYSFHEGGASEAKKQIYTQIGLENFTPEIVLPKDVHLEVTISNRDGKSFLIDSHDHIISKKYYVLRKLLGSTKNGPYFIATYYNEPNKPQKYMLINKEGKELTELMDYLPNCSDYYISISNNEYFFTDNERIIRIPDDFILYVDCYAKEGVLGFKHRKTKVKFFIDKYGNSITNNELKQLLLREERKY